MATTFVPAQLEVDFSGISARSNGPKTPVDGIYPITVLDCGLNVKEGETADSAKSVGFSVQIVEGEFAGYKTWINAGIDMTKLGNRISWKTILVSLGFDESSLSGPTTLNTASYVGLNGFMKFVNKKADPQTEAERYDAREFVTPAAYQTYLNGQTAHTAAPVQTTFRATAPVAPAVAAATNGARPAMPQPTAGANKYMGMVPRQ
jgi:hypothetical protein